LALRAEHVAAGIRHRHGVRARNQVFEPVQPVAIGDGRQADRAAQDVNAEQRHGHARQARLACVLDAVAVQVRPYPIADHRRPQQARVQRVLDLSRRQHQGRRCAAQRVGVTVHGAVAARVGHCEICVAARQLEYDLVLDTRDQGVERIESIAVRQRVHARAVAAGDDQQHRHARHARLVVVLDPIRVQIVPDIIAQGGRLVSANVDGLVELAAAQRIVARSAGCGICIAVQCVILTLIGDREDVSRRQRKDDIIRVRRQFAHFPVTAGIRCRSAHHRTIAGSIYFRQDAVQRRFGCILQSIPVGVHPGVIADGCQIEEDDDVIPGDGFVAAGFIADRGSESGTEKVRK